MFVVVFFIHLPEVEVKVDKRITLAALKKILENYVGVESDKFRVSWISLASSSFNSSSDLQWQLNWGIFIRLQQFTKLLW